MVRQKVLIFSHGGQFADIQTINIGSCYAELPSFNNHKNLTKVEGGKITNTNGMQMFMGCTSLTTFESDLRNLTNGSYMFNHCESLSSFTSELGNLTIGQYMFSYCTSLTTFESDLSNLMNGKFMFTYCSLLNEVTIKVDKSKRTDWETFFTKANLSIREEATLTIKDIDGTILKTT